MRWIILFLSCNYKLISYILNSNLSREIIANIKQLEVIELEAEERERKTKAREEAEQIQLYPWSMKMLAICLLEDQNIFHEWNKTHI